jgi:hypothetical protein
VKFVSLYNSGIIGREERFLPIQKEGVCASEERDQGFNG